MANTLSTGVRIPEGTDNISSTGVEEMRALGSTADTAIRAKASISQMVAAQDQIDQVSAGVDAKLAEIATAYDVAVADGFAGPVTEWLASLVGPKGDEGPYGGTAITAPQLVDLLSNEASVRSALDARYRRTASVLEYGATGDGATDDTAAVQAALTATAGGSVYFPPGAYLLTDVLTVPAGTAIAGADSSTVLLDWSTHAGWFTAALMTWEKGTVSDPALLTVDPVEGDGTVTVAAGHTFVRGDFIRITSDETKYGEAVKAEFQRILEVEGNVLQLSGPMLDSYSTAVNARVERANLGTGSISGVSIKGKGVNPTGYGDDAIDVSLARDFRVSDVRFSDIENKCIYLKSVLGALVHGCHFRFDTSRTPLQYGVAATGATQMLTVSDCLSWNDRHMVTTSTSSMLQASVTEFRGIPRVITVTGCTANGSWQAPVDTHKGGEYVTVTGNALVTESTGVKIRGKNAVVVGNTITGKGVSITGGPCGLYLGMVGENVRVTGNLIRGFRDGVRFDTPDGFTTGLTVAENTFVECSDCVWVGGSTPYYGVRIAGNVFKPRAGGYGVRLNGTFEDIEINVNTFDGGNMAVYVASPSLPVTRLMVHGNTMRNQTSYGMFFRNLTDAFVGMNFSAAREIRFANTCTRVVAAMNQCTVTDLSGGRTVVIK